MDEKLFVLLAAALTALSPIIGSLLQYRQQHHIAERDDMQAVLDTLRTDYARVCEENKALRAERDRLAEENRILAGQLAALDVSRAKESPA